VNGLIAFDSDVLIYAAVPGHPLGSRVTTLFPHDPDTPAGVGSLLLLPEVLTKPMRADPDSEETLVLLSLLSRVDLRPMDLPVARLGLDLGVAYGLHAADAVHLATAVIAGADWFLTNNRRDFPRTIEEIDVIYPQEIQDGSHGRRSMPRG